jgi:hypothetical protein
LGQICQSIRPFSYLSFGLLVFGTLLLHLSEATYLFYKNE